MHHQAVVHIIRILIATVCKLESVWFIIFISLDEEIHRLKVQSPVDEVAELALDDIGKFCPLTWLIIHNDSWSMIHGGIKISKKTPHQVLRQAIKESWNEPCPAHQRIHHLDRRNRDLIWKKSRGRESRKIFVSYSNW